MPKPSPSDVKKRKSELARHFSWLKAARIARSQGMDNDRHTLGLLCHLVVMLNAEIRRLEGLIETKKTTAT